MSQKMGTVVLPEKGVLQYEQPSPARKHKPPLSTDWDCGAYNKALPPLQSHRLLPRLFERVCDVRGCMTSSTYVRMHLARAPLCCTHSEPRYRRVL